MTNHNVALLVEDQADFRLLMGSLLQRRSYTVVEASSGADALAVVKDLTTVALVVCDYDLGDGAGERLIPRLKQISATATSAYVLWTALPNGHALAAKLGVSYLEKIVVADNLDESIAAADALRN